MAVTLTVAELAAAIRVGDTAAETAEVTRLRGYAITAVSRHLGTAYAGAPEDAVNEATVRLVGYLYDSPTVSSGDRLANSLRNSGAASILLPWRLHRAGIIDPVAEAQAAVGTADNPVVDVSVAAHVLTVSFADGTTTTYTLPAGGSGDDAYSWATVGDTTLIPADKLRAPTSALRGAVVAVTNAIIDSDSHTASTLYGWSRSHVKRLVDRLVQAWALDDSTQIPADKLTLAPSSGTQVFVSTDMPTGGAYRLDDIWIRDTTTSPLQIYKWTGTVWAVTYTLPDIPDGADIEAVVEALVATFAFIGSTERIPGSRTGVLLRPPAGNLPAATQADYDLNAVSALDGHWYYIEQTGHDPSTNEWTWGDLNDEGHNDLAQWRGVVSENPFTIPNPQPLDWAYIGNERRWVRRTSSTWVYVTAPAAFDARYRSQHSAETAGLVTVGKFIFSNSHHAMRIIRSYSGDVPGPPIFEWRAFQAPALNLEPWAFRDDNTRVQARKLGAFDQHDIDQIADGGEQTFELRARVHKDPTGVLTSYDLGDWIVSEEGGGGGRWYWIAEATRPFAAGAAQPVVFQSLTGTPWSNYADILTAFNAGTITQIAVRISQNDANDADADHGVEVVPNIVGFVSANRIDVFPGHALAVDPERFRVTFGAGGLTVAAETAIPATSPFVGVRIAVWA